MRCVYHGWKFGADGRCLDMPSEPPESSFAAKVCHVAYPCEERGGVIWAYMGPGERRRRCPSSSGRSCPRPHTLISKRVQECNWFQALEGGIDSSHISFLHAPISHNDAAIARGWTGRASASARPCRRPTGRRASRWSTRTTAR